MAMAFLLVVQLLIFRAFAWVALFL